jgi:hypothetical protein
MSEIIDLEFTEATDKIARLYPPALSRFKKNLESSGFSSEESFELVKIYLKLLVSLVFEADDVQEDDEDEDEREFPL